MKIVVFWLKFSRKFVPNGPIDNNPTLVKIMALAPNRREAIIWTNADPIHWCIYAALRGDELTDPMIIDPGH